MNKLLLLLAFLPVIATAQNGITWHDTITVNSDLMLGFARPKIVLAANDVPVVMWGRANNREVYVSRWNGSGFGAPVKVTPNGMTAFVQNWGGPSMAASGDTVFVTYKSQPEDEGFVYVVRSVDGGQTFGDTVRVSNDNWSRFSEVSVLPGGNPVVTYMQFDSHFLNPRWVVATSSDKGASFSAPVKGSELAPGEVCDCCPGFILARENRTILMFRNNDNNLRDIWLAISSEGGTFPVAADIDHNNWMINSCPASGPNAIMSGDSLMAVWMSGASGYSRINIGTAHLSTLATGVNSEITPSSTANQNYPKITGTGELLVVVWQESSSGNTDIKLVWSTTGPAGLIGKTPVTANLNLPGSQLNPDITYRNGKFHIVWQDMQSFKIMYRTLEINMQSGIEKKKTSAINIYPNPGREFIMVDIPDAGAVEKVNIYNTMGQQVLQQAYPATGKLKLDISALSPGIYYLRMQGNGLSGTKSFVVDR